MTAIWIAGYILGIVTIPSVLYAVDCKKYIEPRARSRMFWNTLAAVFWPILLPVAVVAACFYFSILGLGTLLRRLL